jgi:hypothetical protein
MTKNINLMHILGKTSLASEEIYQDPLPAQPQMNASDVSSITS